MKYVAQRESVPINYASNYIDKTPKLLFRVKFSNNNLGVLLRA